MGRKDREAPASKAQDERSGEQPERERPTEPERERPAVEEDAQAPGSGERPPG